MYSVFAGSSARQSEGFEAASTSAMVFAFCAGASAASTVPEVSDASIAAARRENAFVVARIVPFLSERNER